MYVERNIVSGKYRSKDFDDSDEEEGSEENVTVWVISKDVNMVKPYTYDEALTLTGQGSYSFGLLTVCCICLLAMSLDMLSFKTIIVTSTSDLHIGQWQHKFLLSMPFLGAISTAYVWGYVCDTQGRRQSLLVAMWGSFIASTLSAFSPNWIALAVLKFLSVAFCSCAQSATFMLIGESCPVWVKNTYYCILMTSVHPAVAIYTGLGYVSIENNFALDLGLLTFTSWRLLVLVLALPLGISAISLHFYYESPKFLVNAGKNRLALEILKNIWKRNNCVGKKYPVEKLILEEEGNIKFRKLPILHSLWEHTKPLFKLPLLYRTLQLYFLIIVLCSITGIFIVWFPKLIVVFINGIFFSHKMHDGICNFFEHNLNDTYESGTYHPELTITDVCSSSVHGLILIIANINIIKFKNRKQLVIVMLTIIALSSACCIIFGDSLNSIPIFFIISLSAIVTGYIYSYLVDLYPTSVRGMVGCLSMVMASTSGFVGSNVATLFMSDCIDVFYIITLTTLCGILVACLLPSDIPK